MLFFSQEALLFQVDMFSLEEPESSSKGPTMILIVTLRRLVQTPINTDVSPYVAPRKSSTTLSPSQDEFPGSHSWGQLASPPLAEWGYGLGFGVRLGFESWSTTD